MKKIYALIFFEILSILSFAQNLDFQYYFNGQISNFQTSSVSSDYGKRVRETSSWHKGVDFGGDLGASIMAIEGGVVGKLQSSGYRYIGISGTNNFCYGHIFEDDDDALGNFVIVQVDGKTRYAILNTVTGVAIGTNNTDRVTYGGRTYQVQNTVIQGQQIAPLGNSGGNYPNHVHLYRLRNIAGAVGEANNCLNPLQVLNHSIPNYTVAIENNTTTPYRITQVNSTQYYGGNESSSVCVKVQMNNSGLFGSTPNVKYRNATMNLEKVELFIKAQGEVNSAYSLIRGISFESRIEYGGMRNANSTFTAIYPSRMTTDASPFANNSYSGIEPHAYNDLDYDRFFFSDIFTRIHKNHNVGSTPGTFAECIKDALYPDGVYNLYARVTTITNNQVDNIANPLSIRIDNFRPYVEKVEIRNGSSSGELVYSGNWDWSNNALVLSIQSGAVLSANNALWVKATTSEPMQSLILSAFGVQNKAGAGSANGIDWTFTYTASEVTAGNQTLIFSRNSLDLAGNPLFGLTTSPVEGVNIPKRQSDGTFVPNVSGDDNCHKLVVVNSVADIPASIKATSNLTDKVTVFWSAVSGATHYNVYRNTINNSSTATSLSGWITTTLFNDVSAIPGTTYYYWVKSAKSSTGAYASDFSSAVTGKRPSSVTADFAFQQNSYYPNYTVNFTNNSSANAVKWFWDFGDGYSDYVSPTRDISHNFPSTGSFYVTLTVFDSYNNISSITKKVEITEDYNSTIDITPYYFSLSDYVYEFSVHVNDPDPSHYHDIRVNFGDGSPEATVYYNEFFDEKVYHEYSMPSTIKKIYPYAVVTTRNSYGETVFVKTVDFSPIMLYPPVVELDLSITSFNATNPSKPYIAPNEQAKFKVTCSNCDGDEYYAWTINTIPGQLSEPCNCNTAPSTCISFGGTTTGAVTFKETGNYLITAFAWDGMNQGSASYILYVGDMKSPCVIAQFKDDEVASTSEFALGSVISLGDASRIDISTSSCFSNYGSSNGDIRASWWYFDNGTPKKIYLYEYGFVKQPKCFKLDVLGDHKITLEAYAGKSNGKFDYVKNPDGSYVFSSVTKRIKVIDPNSSRSISNIFTLRLLKNPQGNIEIKPLSSITVNSGESISLVAYKSITLRPGVTIKAGSSFQAKIVESPKLFNCECYEDNWKTSLVTEDNILFDTFPFKVYPNPARSFIQIDFEQDPSLVKKIEIYNATGSLMLVKDSGIDYQNHIELNGFTHGAYCVRILLSDRVVNKIFVKQ